MNYILTMSSAAREELREAYLWYEKERNNLGKELVTSFEQRTELLLSNPQQYPIVHKNIR